MRRFNFIHLATAFLVVLFFSQCFYDTMVPDPIILPDEVSFQADILPIFNASCNMSGCHNTGGIAPDLSEANAFTSLIAGSYVVKTAPETSVLYQWMLGNEAINMPPSGPNATYNALVLQWITEGAFNN
ncbi:MAG: hypothetical protein IPJ40_02685 [Saprospirales bacterium]|nr:hypothetical protein [Saprospirales bacterium]